MKHKWAEVIKAWADGYEIQYRVEGTKDWEGWGDFEELTSMESISNEWRIKPKEVVMYKWAALSKYGNWIESTYFSVDESQFRKQSGIKTSYVKRLDYTATSFPVDGDL